MGSIDRYIFRTTLASFALVLVSLTGVIWITQALRGIDLMTSQGQTILTFLGITSLVIPALVLIIAPIALMIAISHTLNKLATDSEIIVMNAAGLSPFRLFRPFFYATCVVALLVAFIGAYLAPDGMRRIKQWDAEITADVLTNILQPGRFAQLDQNLTIRIRERQPGGVLAGIFVDDRRDPKERVTIIADHGTVLKNDNGSFLMLEDGNLERFEAGKRDPALVAFGRYAFDMSKFSQSGRDVALGIRERYIWELVSPDADDPMYKQLPGQFRAELHDRFMAPIYPFAFAVLTFAFLGAPRTTRQSRNFSIGGSIFAVFGLRMAGFACSVMTVKTPARRADPICHAVRRDRRRPVDDHRRRRGRTAGRRCSRPSTDRTRALRGCSDGRSQHEHDDQHARALFRRPLPGRGGGRVCQHLRAAGAGRLHRDGAQDLGPGLGLAITVAETSLFRVPQLLEKLMPFCVLIGAMTCYLALSRRLELVVARAAGVSAWQFIAPALASAILLGVLATTAYNPVSANLRELSKRMEAEMFGSAPGGGIQDAAGFWLNQINSDGQSIINAARSEQQGVRLTGLTVFRFDTDLQFKERIEARAASLEDGRWAFKSVRRYSLDKPPIDQETYYLATTLTPAQVRNSFSTPETVSFWQLPGYIRSSESSGFATAGYRLQYHKLIAQPFLLAAMVMLAASVSLRFFRMGGVQKMVLSGVGAGFLLYVLSKVTEDLSKAELMHPIAAAWLPVCVGGLTGFLALLYQEDG